MLDPFPHSCKLEGGAERWSFQWSGLYIVYTYGGTGLV